MKFEIVDCPNMGGMLVLGLIFGAFNLYSMLDSFVSKECEVRYE